MSSFCCTAICVWLAVSAESSRSDETWHGHGSPQLIGVLVQVGEHLALRWYLEHPHQPVERILQGVERYDHPTQLALELIQPLHRLAAVGRRRPRPRPRRRRSRIRRAPARSRRSPRRSRRPYRGGPRRSCAGSARATLRSSPSGLVPPCRIVTIECGRTSNGHLTERCDLLGPSSYLMVRRTSWSVCRCTVAPGGRGE